MPSQLGRKSLKFKLIGTTSIILILGIAVSGWFVFQKAQSTILDSEWSAMNDSLRQQSERITRYLDNARHDAIVLSHAPNIQSILRGLEESTEETHAGDIRNEFLELANQFARLIEQKGYLQIRLIDTKTGMEVVRVDRPDASTLVPIKKQVKDLQYKGDTEYVRQAKRLRRDEVYISDINLNREFGKISEPHQPTQRFAVGVFREHQLFKEKIDIHELTDYIRHFDHELSTSTIRAVQTGNLFWREHYNYIAPRLDIALKEAKTFVGEKLYFLIDKIDETNIDLIRIEDEAFSLTAAGQAATAESLITGTRYKQLKSEYKRAIDTLLEQLESKDPESRLKQGARALIVINTNFQDVLSSLKALKTHETTLTNAKGEFLYHEDEEKQFAFEFSDSAPTIEDEEKELWSNLISGVQEQPHFDHHNELHVSKRIFFGDDNSDRFIGLMLAKEKSEVLTPVFELGQYLIYTTLLAILVSLSITLLFLSRQIRPISTLTLHATKIAQGDLKKKLPKIDSDDEVGQLADAFSDLIEKLQAQSNATKEQSLIVKALNDELEERITERTAKLNEVSKRAQAASNAKSEFLATMSHEIRTPLNGMLGMAQVLSQTELNQTQQEQIKTILNSGNSLLSIIDDILDFSKIEAGKLELEPINFDLRMILQDILKLMHGRAKEKELRLHINYPIEVQSLFLGDPGRIRQIIMNLVGNAIKFTAKGEVSIKVEASLIQKAYAELVISVTDTGIGISSEKQKYLFNSFQQADSSTTRKFGGTGLGLAICKKLVELMDGDIGCESQDGEGSTFWFRIRLPCSEKNPDELKPEAAPNLVESPEAVQFQDARILLVEDNSINQMVAKSFLDNMGLVVEIAENGLQAVAMWKEGHYDLILMDCLMPEMDGYEATQQIRSLENEDEHIVIVAVTANVLPSDQAKCQESGMDDFVPKPLDFKVLRTCLQKWLK